MGLYKNLFKQTALYGLATVVPRMFSFILLPLYTYYLNSASDYGMMTVVFSYLVFMNVILSYGMETSFFRFYHSKYDKQKVIQTATISIFLSSVGFLILALFFRNIIAELTHIDKRYVIYTIWILVFDALVVIPFSKLRALEKPKQYAVIKICNTAVNLGLNIFFLIALPNLVENNIVFSHIYIENFQIGYVFISNLIASLLTFLYFIPGYIVLKWKFDFELFRRMISYSLPVLFAGIAFAVNEHLDKILLENLLDDSISQHQVGIYAACYKLGLFMVLFSTAFRLGIEPFFFSHAQNKNAPETYAEITKYFIILGSFILLTVIVFSDVLKVLMIKNKVYWDGMKVVPLIVLANLCLGIYTNISVWYKLIDKTKIGAYISLVGAFLTLLLNFILIPKYSYIGSAIATLVAYGVMMIISYLLGRKHYYIPYDIKKIGIYLGTSLVLSYVYFYHFRENYFVGIVYIAMFLAIIYRLENKTIKNLLKK